MRLPRRAGLVLVCGCVAALIAAAASGATEATDPSAIAKRLVQALALQPGEKVLLVRQPGVFDEMAPLVRRAVVEAGGIDLGALETIPGNALPEAARKQAIESLKAMLAPVDAAIMMPGATPLDAAYAALQALLREQGGARRTIHFHWDGGGAPSATPVPGGMLPSPDDVSATYRRAILETDLAALASAQRAFETAMRGAEVHVTTPLGTDIRFRIADRHVTRQDGDASAERARQAVVLIDREVEIPAGAIRVAPIEESVKGVIVFPPSQWGGREVTGLKLGFHKGRVISIEAASGKDAVEEELAKGGDGARSFREFALGFNPMLAVPKDRPWIPYYGYGAGVVRLSLGDNSELGGKVTGGYVRWNFFTDATVSVGDRVWVRGGRMVPR